MTLYIKKKRNQAKAVEAKVVEVKSGQSERLWRGEY